MKDSSDQITVFHCLLVHALWLKHQFFLLQVLVSLINSFWIPAQPEIVLAGFGSTAFISAVTFAAVVFLFFITILFNDHLSRSFNTHFCRAMAEW